MSLSRRTFLGFAGMAAISALTACGSKGTLNITGNGEYDVSGYDKVNVNVGGSDSAGDSSSAVTSNGGSSASSGAVATPATANIGDEIPVSTDKGDLKVTVEGFETSEKLTQNFTDTLTPGNLLGCLLLIVENISYEDQYNVNYVQLNPDVSVKDRDGITLNPLNSSQDYGQYRGAAGAFLELPKGQKSRVAVEYDLSPDIDHLTVVVGSATVGVDVAHK